MFVKKRLHIHDFMKKILVLFIIIQHFPAPLTFFGGVPFFAMSLSQEYHLFKSGQSFKKLKSHDDIFHPFQTNTNIQNNHPSAPTHSKGGLISLQPGAFFDKASVTVIDLVLVTCPSHGIFLLVNQYHNIFTSLNSQDVLVILQPISPF